VAALWARVFGYDVPHNDPLVSIERKTARDPDLFLIAAAGTRLVGTVMGGYDGHRGWVYSLAVEEGERRMGIGTALMREVEQKLRVLGCRKVNLQVVGTNSGVVGFYEGLGFSVEDRISMGKRLY
jgi:ribosomal protein S18 acetylase RimI-like enzyme